ncbi:MAG TPA: transporter substrate-binding domain-containing protein [Erysipelothrix sp.]|nr:transporter substrate-binding domain-containing protein [Erysipelothrix sp.]
MKKFLTIGITFMVMMSLVACGSKKDDTDALTGVEKIQAKGELVLLTESGFPPFEYADNGEGAVDGVNGVDIEFGKALAEKLGVTLKVEDMDFDTLTVALASDKGDIIAAGMTNTPDRAEVVDFSNTYFDNGLFILVPNDTDITSVEDLKGKKIAVQQGTTGNEYVNTVEGAEALEFKGMVEAGLAVANGNADASVMDKLTAEILANNNKNLKVLEGALVSEETAIAVAKEDKTLLDAVNELLAELQADGTLDKWFDEHFDSLLD